MSFPPPPSNTLDWGKLGFQYRTLNGHIESRYSHKTKTWTTPKLVRSPYLSIHGMCPGLNYGQQAFEGLKAFRMPAGDDRIAIFRPQMNAERLAHSADMVSIPPLPEDVFVHCCQLVVGSNAEFVPPHESPASMYIRPLVFGSSPQLGLNPPEEYTFCVFVSPVSVYHGVKPVAALILEDFDRAAPEGTGNAKLGGNYAPVLKWSEKARSEGFGITLHLDSKTRSEIDEFSTSGFIGVKKSDGGDITLAVPDSKCVIKSFTSDSICEIAKSLGWKVECRSIKYEELPAFSEVMAAGTAAALVPVNSITMKSKGDKFSYNGGGDEPGPVMLKLLDTLRGIQSGRIKDSFGWRKYVDKPKDYEKENDAVNEQKYQGTLYKQKPSKKSVKIAPIESSISRAAYVEDAPDPDTGNGIVIVEPPPEAPVPPPAVLEQPNVNVFDFLVTDETPNASRVSLVPGGQNGMDYTPSVIGSEISRKKSSTVHDPQYEKHGFSYGTEALPATHKKENAHFEYITPASKELRKQLEKTEGRSTDKKRKRLQVEELDLSVARRPSQESSDAIMSDAPPAVLHSGLTGGLNRLLSKSKFPPSPDYSNDPPSPVKRSKSASTSQALVKKDRDRDHSKSTARSTSNALVKVRKRRTSDESRPRKKKRHHTSHNDDESSTHRRKKHRPKAIEYPSSQAPEDSQQQLVVFKTRAEFFMSLVTKGEESERGDEYA
ncbi:uncharacterized protein KY384_008977 [Bacidia gigantensis]|uniref:uncharacterized protein n=1 Tax=Bacidia gigantensis TaxID=2732470 RepID=UPI001D0508E1|nr:uncharacterized protein KY384_008977 [Bacidia gigantensis]KAG8525333.1 hypothetical protein KY384_008977 [Bacidia gigantensis]